MDISKFKITDLPFGERRNTHKPDIKIFEYLKEDGIRQAVNDHYELLIKSEIKDLFPLAGELLEGAKKRSADFFIQRLGGPEYYKITRGNPMLANRHLPFKITPQARIVWLECYREVLCKIDTVPENLMLKYWMWLDEFSNWMVNQHEDPKYKVDIIIPRNF
jgi:hemoglobin